MSKKSTTNQSYQGIKEVDSKLETTQEQTKTPVFNLNLPNPSSPFVLNQEIYSANDRSNNMQYYEAMSPDADDRPIPRTSPRVRPEEQMTFDEPSASRVPSKIMTPNNVSSFIELLNYNSETDLDPNDFVKSRLDCSKIQKVAQDTTQEFIQEALADIRASNAKSRGSTDKNPRAIEQPSTKEAPRRRGTQLFPNIDDELKKHALRHGVSDFVGIEFIRPTKHSARATLPDTAPSLDFEGLRPLVCSSDEEPGQPASRPAMRSRRHRQSQSFFQQVRVGPCKEQQTLFKTYS